MSVLVCCDRIRCTPTAAIEVTDCSAESVTQGVTTISPLSIAIDEAAGAIYLGGFTGGVSNGAVAKISISGLSQQALYVNSAQASSSVTGVCFDNTYVYAQYNRASGPGGNYITRLLKSDLSFVDTIASPVNTSLMATKGITLMGGKLYVSDWNTAAVRYAVSRFDAATFLYEATSTVSEAPTAANRSVQSIINDGTSVFLSVGPIQQVVPFTVSTAIYRFDAAGVQTGKWLGGVGPIRAFSLAYDPSDAAHIYAHILVAALSTTQRKFDKTAMTEVAQLPVTAPSQNTGASAAAGGLLLTCGVPGANAAIYRIPTGLFNSSTEIEEQPLPWGVVGFLSTGQAVAAQLNIVKVFNP